MAYKVVAQLAHDSGMPEDAVTNTFVFASQAPGVGEADAALLSSIVQDFYLATPAGEVNSVAGYLSPSLSSAADQAVMSVYDLTGHLSGTPHGSPIFQETWTLSPLPDAGTVRFPEEVACCITIEASGRSEQLVETSDGGDPGSAIDRPRSRYTGRVYIGPLIAAAGEVVGGIVRPTVAMQQVFRKALIEMHDASTLLASVAGLGVWSRADGVVRVIGGCSTDNAFDTQRRRGPAASARTRLSA